MQTRSISEVIARMQALVPPGAPEPQDPQILEQLSTLTQELIRAYQAAGRLQTDPFGEAQARQLFLYETEVRQQLAEQVVLVTGGEGCVGSHLIERLLDLGVKRIISVDKVRCGSGEIQPLPGQHPAVSLYAADLRHYDEVQQIFAIEQPTIVFHLAAQRLPGLAEKQIHETVTSNIFGTQNIIRLCEEFGVGQCIFSSTGKASRYYTAEVYAATKKVCEWLFAQAALAGKVRYGMVRFTHMLDNSSMCQQIEEKLAQGKPVNIHAPDRYVAGQNVREAAHLLLNSLAFSEVGQLKFLLVRNLGWPTESLEVALYKIMQSGSSLPIYFQGVQPGYEESFFLGQVDWDDQLEINTLINALETSFHSEISSSGDMIVAETIPFAISTLTNYLEALRQLSDNSIVAEPLIKLKLAETIREVSSSCFWAAEPEKTLRILRWGINPKHVQQGNLKLVDHRDIVEILVRSLAQRSIGEVLETVNVSLADFTELLTVLEELPSLQVEVALLGEAAGCPTSTLTARGELLPIAEAECVGISA